MRLLCFRRKKINNYMRAFWLDTETCSSISRESLLMNYIYFARLSIKWKILDFKFFAELAY